MSYSHLTPLATRKFVQISLLAEKGNVNLDDTIQNTFAYHVQVESCRNAFGAIHYAITNGGWDTLRAYSTQHETRVSSFLMSQEQSLQRVYAAPPVETLKAMYGLTN